MSPATSPGAPVAVRPSSAPAEGTSGRRFAVGVAMVGVVALAVRVAYVLAVGRHLPLGGDAETYHLLADRLADGRGYVRPWGLAGIPGDVPTAEFPPLFPGLLALVDLGGIDSVTGQKLALAVVGAATAVVVGLVARRVAGESAGIAAAAIVALHPAFFQHDAGLAAESLYVLVVAVILLVAYRAAGNARLRVWAILGALIGAAALVRAEALGLLIVLVLPLAWVRVDLACAARLARAGAAVATAVAVVAPWTIRNAVVVDAFVPVSSNAGTLLAGANCDQVYSGPATGLWSLDCVFAVDAPARNEGERNAAYLDEGLDYIGAHGADQPRVMAVRVLRTWGGYDPSGQIAWEVFEGRHRGWHIAAYAVHLVLAACAVPGAWLLRRRAVTLLPLLAMVVLVIGVSAVAYGNQRFRVAADLSLAVLAGTALSNLRQ